jgi:hypothetical protein
MPRPQFTIRALLVVVLFVAAFFGGIHFERRWKHPDSTVGQRVKTIYLRPVDAMQLRRDTAEQLLDAVRLQIELTTPFKAVARSSEADSELLCTVSVAGDALQIKVEWKDRHGAQLKPLVAIPLDDLSSGGINYTANGIANFVQPGS